MKINILIVDDSKSILYIIEDLLERINDSYNIIMANGGKKALEIIEDDEIDLIILDIHMPDMDGFEVAQVLKSDKRTTDIPIVFLTASTTLRTEGLAIGAVDYLTKPIDENQFTSRISLYTRLVTSIKENRQKDQHLMHNTRLAQMGEMISMIAHQWRQPLSSISAISANTRLKLQLSTFDLSIDNGIEKQNLFIEDELKKIENKVQNLSTTIDDFRKFYTPNKQSVNRVLDEIIPKSINIIRATLIDNNVEIVEKYNSKGSIEIYDSEIMQVILNIIKNSQENFQEKNIENPNITIKTDARVISIYDNGGGVAEDLIDKIFDPYFSTKDEKNGTGLGLYMSKVIIEDHHVGHLNVNNTDDGICFTIEIGELSKN